MCRHLAYLGPPRTLAALLTEPPHGLYTQAHAPRRQRYGTVNADGYGVGWYPGRPDPDGGGPEDGAGAAPARYRRSVPIWADANLPDLARTVRSGAVLAAVRDASVGSSQDESAVAPYRDGGWLFSLNGAVPEWTRLPAAALAPLSPAELLALDARCDTALLWALLRQRLRRGEPAARALPAVVRQIAAASPDARLNLLLTDGRTIVATRHGDSLWYRHAPGEVRVASEPDSADESAWREVPQHALVLADRAGVRVTGLYPEADTARPAGSATEADTEPTTARPAGSATEPATAPPAGSATEPAAGPPAAPGADPPTGRRPAPPPPSPGERTPST